MTYVSMFPFHTSSPLRLEVLEGQKEIKNCAEYSRQYSHAWCDKHFYFHLMLRCKSIEALNCIKVIVNITSKYLYSLNSLGGVRKGEFLL